MFKDTCLVALERKCQSPRMFDLEILVYLILEVFVCWLWDDSLNAQAYNQTNAAIIRI
jgi:hypothetical protein